MNAYKILSIFSLITLLLLTACGGSGRTGTSSGVGSVESSCVSVSAIDNEILIPTFSDIKLIANEVYLTGYNIYYCTESDCAAAASWTKYTIGDQLSFKSAHLSIKIYDENGATVCSQTLDISNAIPVNIAELNYNMSKNLGIADGLLYLNGSRSFPTTDGFFNVDYLYYSPAKAAAISSIRTSMVSTSNKPFVGFSTFDLKKRTVGVLKNSAGSPFMADMQTLDGSSSYDYFVLGRGTLMIRTYQEQCETNWCDDYGYWDSWLTKFQIAPISKGVLGEFKALNFSAAVQNDYDYLVVDDYWFGDDQIPMAAMYSPDQDTSFYVDLQKDTKGNWVLGYFKNSAGELLKDIQPKILDVQNTGDAPSAVMNNFYFVYEAQPQTRYLALEDGVRNGRDVSVGTISLADAGGSESVTYLSGSKIGTDGVVKEFITVPTDIASDYNLWKVVFDQTGTARLLILQDLSNTNYMSGYDLTKGKLLTTSQGGTWRVAGIGNFSGFSAFYNIANSKITIFFNNEDVPQVEFYTITDGVVSNNVVKFPGYLDNPFAETATTVLGNYNPENNGSALARLNLATSEVEFITENWTKTLVNPSGGALRDFMTAATISAGIELRSSKSYFRVSDDGVMMGFEGARDPYGTFIGFLPALGKNIFGLRSEVRKNIFGEQPNMSSISAEAQQGIFGLMNSLYMSASFFQNPDDSSFLLSEDSANSLPGLGQLLFVAPASSTEVNIAMLPIIEFKLVPISPEPDK